MTRAAIPAASTRAEIPYTLFTLPNGLTVIVHEDHSVPRVSVNVWYHVGSGRERPGRTGLAHLFEHIMFEGSAHVPEGKFDQWLENVGGNNNGSTNEDRTNYWEDVPSNTLELALFLESDRMGYLLPTMTPQRVDGQREVVKNERRQSYENRPYGVADLALPEAVFPPAHPYSWTVIGSTADLTAASFEDIVSFFKLYYCPANACLVIAGDVDTAAAHALALKWFGGLPAGTRPPPIQVPDVELGEEKHIVLEDHVELPKLVVAWPTVRLFDPRDAALDVLSEVLARGKNSRLYRRLVYELQVAQDVQAYQNSLRFGGLMTIEVMARPGHALGAMLNLVDAEIQDVRDRGPSERERDRSVHGIETRFLDSRERLGGFGGRADQLNSYWFYAGDPGYFAADLARYREIVPRDIQMAAQRFLTEKRVVISVVPMGKKDLAVPARSTG
jgi:zinc protease